MLTIDIFVSEYAEDPEAGACLLRLSDGSTAWAFSEEAVKGAISEVGAEAWVTTSVNAPESEINQ